MPEQVKRPDEYYIAQGRGCDDIFRCAACQKLVTAHVISNLGRCTCGSSRLAQVQTLTPEEQADIASGKISFRDSDLFLREFAPVDPEAVPKDGPIDKKPTIPPGGF